MKITSRLCLIVEDRQLIQPVAIVCCTYSTHAGIKIAVPHQDQYSNETCWHFIPVSKSALRTGMTLGSQLEVCLTGSYQDL